MIRVMMPAFKSLRGYVIPGDWIAIVPRFHADPDYEAWLTGKILQDNNYDREKAVADARARIHAIGQTFFLSSLKYFLSRCADDYGKKFPDLRNPDKTLRGFEPAKLQGIFIPHRKSRGRHGETGIKKMLLEMAEAERSRMYDDQNAA